MVQKIGKILLAASLLVYVPMQSRDTECFSKLVVKKALCVNGIANINQLCANTANITTATIGTANITTANITTDNITTANIGTANITTANIGTANVTQLNVGGANFNNLINLANFIGPNPVGPGLGTLVSSIIPFSSGLISIAAVVPPTPPTLGPVFATIPAASGLVMAFGSSSLQAAAANPTVTDTGYAFSVPQAGTLRNLRVSVDSFFLAAALVTSFTFTFTVIISPCVSGVAAPAYTATTLTATATTTAVGVLLAQGTTGCGFNNTNIITVAPGDRVTIRVTPNVDVLPTSLVNLSLSAGFMYSPA